MDILVFQDRLLDFSFTWSKASESSIVFFIDETEPVDMEKYLFEYGDEPILVAFWSSDLSD